MYNISPKRFLPNTFFVNSMVATVLLFAYILVYGPVIKTELFYLIIYKAFTFCCTAYLLYKDMNFNNNRAVISNHIEDEILHSPKFPSCKLFRKGFHGQGRISLDYQKYYY